MEKTVFGGWQNCYRLSNGTLELIVTADVGPRVIYLGFVNQYNEFKVFDHQAGLTGGDEWRNYGGHRLWHAPEVHPRTYYPDNQPVEVAGTDNSLRAVAPIEQNNGIQKELLIRFIDKRQVHVRHIIHNRGVWDIDLAVWALTVMAPGGIAIMPLPPRLSHRENLLPTSTLVLWAYTDLSDRRFMWGKQHILLKQDSDSTMPQKIGSLNTSGWLAYARNNHLFVKTFTPIADAHYVDMGCNSEVFTNNAMLELETLSPLQKLHPGQSAVHDEVWALFDDVPAPNSGEDVVQAIEPLVWPLLGQSSS